MTVFSVVKPITDLASYCVHHVHRPASRTSVEVTQARQRNNSISSDMTKTSALGRAPHAAPENTNVGVAQPSLDDVQLALLTQRVSVWVAVEFKSVEIAICDDVAGVKLGGTDIGPLTSNFASSVSFFLKSGVFVQTSCTPVGASE